LIVNWFIKVGCRGGSRQLFLFNAHSNKKEAVQKVKKERHYDEERRSNTLNISTIHLREAMV